MRTLDTLHFAFQTLHTQRLRSLLTGLGIAVGIAAVVLLTAIGSGVQRYILAEFTQFGTNLIAVVPGKTSTFGMSGAVINNIRPLTLSDSDSLRNLPGVEAVVPLIQGNAAVEAGKLSRHSYIFGVGAEVPAVWSFPVASGKFLPHDESAAERAFAVLGSTLREELFADRNPLGQWIRIGGERFRVIGVMESKGQFLGFDIDDAVYIPTGRALEMFNKESLMEVDILYRAGVEADTMAERIKSRMLSRHGREDFTIITQEQMLEVLGSILDILGFAVTALGGISLIVGGVGIFTIMTIAVNERINEIGLLRAVGASRQQILRIFLGEAAILAATGGLTGLLLGLGLAGLIALTLPALPIHPDLGFLLLAESIAIFIGLVAGVLPAQRAARLDPVEALRAE